MARGPDAHTREARGQVCAPRPCPLPGARRSTHPAFAGGGAGSPLVLTGLCGEGVGDGDGDEEKDRDLGSEPR